MGSISLSQQLLPFEVILLTANDRFYQGTAQIKLDNGGTPGVVFHYYGLLCPHGHSPGASNCRRLLAIHGASLVPAPRDPDVLSQLCLTNTWL